MKRIYDSSLSYKPSFHIHRSSNSECLLSVDLLELENLVTSVAREAGGSVTHVNVNRCFTLCTFTLKDL
jgi:hypothetical protein